MVTPDTRITEETLDEAIFGKFGERWQKTITSLAKLLDVPVAIIFKREEDRIRVISTNDNKRNPFEPNQSIPIKGSFCNYVFKSNDKFKVPDYHDIDLDINNVATQSDFISYLGFPLTWPNGENFGTICLLDDTRNYFSGATEEFLENFKDMVNDSLRLIDLSYSLKRETEEMEGQIMTQSENRFIPICPNCLKVQYKDTWINVQEFLSIDPTKLGDKMVKSRPSQHNCVN